MLWLNASYPDQKVEPVTAKVWFEDLELEDAGVVAVALRRCRRMSSYRPQLASILEMCREVRTERAATPKASDATRTCPGCCTSDIAGWLEGAEGWHPCGDCRAGRSHAWERMRESGFTTSRTGGRNWMTAPIDKATGFPTIREGTA